MIFFLIQRDLDDWEKCYIKEYIILYVYPLIFLKLLKSFIKYKLSFFLYSFRYIWRDLRLTIIFYSFYKELFNIYEMDQKMLLTLLLYKNVIREITSTLLWKHPHYLLSYIFLEFLYLRLQRLFKQNLCWIILPDTTIRHMLNNFKNAGDEYIDYECCALANIQFLKKSQSFWFSVCSMISMKKYKCAIISVDHVNENTILISETMQHNLQNALCYEQLDDSCFISKYLYILLNTH